MIRTSQLEYAKTILSKVAFDRGLFRKEYRKALVQLDQVEQKQLRRWLKVYMRMGRGTATQIGRDSQTRGLWLVYRPADVLQAPVSVVELHEEMDIRHQQPGEYSMYTSRDEAIRAAQDLRDKHHLKTIRIVYPDGSFEVLKQHSP